MRRDETRDAVTEYVRDRLVRECMERGKAAEIARATNFSPQHVALVRAGKVGAGDVFLRALLKHWNIRREDLEAALGLEPTYKEVGVYPNRAAAAEWAAEMPWPPEAYADVLKEEPTEDHPRGVWFLKCFFAVQLYAGGRQATAPPSQARARARR